MDSSIAFLASLFELMLSITEPKILYMILYYNFPSYFCTSLPPPLPSNNLSIRLDTEKFKPASLTFLINKSFNFYNNVPPLIF
jgi:hypothetical protein